eukprot:scaffold269708_cov13-Tisochrysis_lutea.AAC.1
MEMHSLEQGGLASVWRAAVHDFVRFTGNWALLAGIGFPHLTSCILSGFFFALCCPGSSPGTCILKKRKDKKLCEEHSPLVPMAESSFKLC